MAFLMAIFQKLVFGVNSTLVHGFVLRSIFIIYVPFCRQVLKTYNFLLGVKYFFSLVLVTVKRYSK